MKILINTTAFDVFIDDVAQTVPASGLLVVDPSDYDKYGQSVSVINLLTAGTLLLNDGVRNLSLTEALKFILLPTFSENLRFKENAINGNGFDSTEAQSAIEEASEMFGFYRIAPTKTIKIKENRTMTVAEQFEIEGVMIVEGRLSIL